MRKILTFISAGVLMSALCVACGGNGNGPEPPKTTELPELPEPPKEPEVIGMLPVSESDVPDEVTAFFEEYLPESNSSRPPHEFNFGDIDNLDTACLIIHNTDEFRAVAPPSVELPMIDFEKYSLVIGLNPMGDPGYRLKKQGIDTEPEVMVLNLIYESLGGATPAIMTTFYFWGLYPKLPQKPIILSVDWPYKEYNE